MIVFFLFIEISPIEAQEKHCDFEDIARLAARSACQQSNTVFACQNLIIFEGTAASTTLLSMNSTKPEIKMVKEYLKNSRLLSERMKSDYRTLLEVYYELKRKNSNPEKFENPAKKLLEDPNLRSMFSKTQADKMSAPLDQMENELYQVEFDRFRNELRHHPKLKDNLMLEAYLSNNHAGDYVQHYYKDPKIYEKAGLKMTGIPPQVLSTLHSQLGHPRAQLTALSFFSIFTSTSKTSGYPQNKGGRRPGMMSGLREKIKLNSYELMNTKLGHTSQVNSVGLLSAIGFAANLGLPLLDEASRQTAVISCARDLGIQLDNEDSLRIARSIHLKKGLMGSSKSCQNISLSASGVEQFLLSDREMKASTMSFLCQLEKKLAVLQDSDVKDKMQRTMEYNANCQEHTSFPTSAGQFSISYRTDNSWDYSTLESDSPAAKVIISEKLRNPFVSLITLPYTLNPNVLCDGRESQGEDQKALCELSKEMNMAAQSWVVHTTACSLVSNQRTTSGPKTSIEGTR